MDHASGPIKPGVGSSFVLMICEDEAAAPRISAPHWRNGALFSTYMGVKTLKHLFTEVALGPRGLPASR